MGRQKGNSKKSEKFTPETKSPSTPGFKKRNFVDELLEKKAIKKKQMEEIESYEVGDLVFAKVRSFDPWPARIEEVNEWETIVGSSKEYLYTVMFFGTHEVQSDIPSKDIYLYNEESIQKFGKPKKLKTKFEASMVEIEKSCNVLASDPFNEPSVPGPSSGLARSRGTPSTVVDDDSDNECDANWAAVPLDITISSPATKRIKLTENDSPRSTLESADDTISVELNGGMENFENFTVARRLPVEPNDVSQVDESATISKDDYECLTNSHAAERIEMTDDDASPPTEKCELGSSLNGETDKFENIPKVDFSSLVQNDDGESASVLNDVDECLSVFSAVDEINSKKEDTLMSTEELMQETVPLKLFHKKEKLETIPNFYSERSEQNNNSQIVVTPMFSIDAGCPTVASVKTLSSPAANQPMKKRPPSVWDFVEHDEALHKKFGCLQRLIHYEMLLKMCSSDLFGAYDYEKCIFYLETLSNDAVFNKENILCVPTLVMCVNRIANGSDNEEVVKLAKAILSCVAMFFNDIEPLDLDSFTEMFKEKSNEYLLANPRCNFYSRAKSSINK